MLMKKPVDILIVDDEPNYLKALSDVLKKKGYRVDTATSADQLITKAKKKPFNIILTDIRLPGMEGAKTFKEIKKISPRTTIIVMAAYYEKDIEKEYIEAGAHCCLLKPIDIDKLIGIIEETKGLKRKK